MNDLLTPVSTESKEFEKAKEYLKKLGEKYGSEYYFECNGYAFRIKRKNLLSKIFGSFFDTTFSISRYSIKNHEFTLWPGKGEFFFSKDPGELVLWIKNDLEEIEKKSIEKSNRAEFDRRKWKKF